MSLKMTKLSLQIAVAGTFCTAFFAQADVTIGVAGPFTGPNATYGAQYWKGASQAVADINAAGGIKGEKIVLVQGDDACEPKQAVAVANRLVDESKVSAVVGHFCSSSTMPASEVYDEAGVLTITPGSTNPLITERGMKSMFRMCGRDDQQGVVAANYMLDVLKAKKIAIIHDKDTYGQGLADATKAALAKRGTKEVLYEGLSRGEKDFNALVTKIGALKPDVVYFGGCHPEAGPLVRQMREQGVTAKFFSGDCVVTEEMVTAAGGAQYTNGVLMTFGNDPRTIPAGKAVIEKFRAGGFEPEGYTLYAYASIQAIAAAYNGAGKDNEKASEWLKSHDVETVMGAKSWDGKGDLKVSDYVVYQWDDKGKYHQL
ncbi:branched-chain amino acid ABC transporter substrate-binding protein [Enterobacter kobei]|uniref:Branched chain amino acid ABC transporter substrate-binding protein n=2 Tax=Enterobacter kobei TaxID=208224 RepID=A0ACC8SDN1_9ENTR|nr:branched-chain amino acid ABC transporter substrate-binding protein [Enterobacter kobei]OLR21607.1 branched chain amino acid ABC transporter substrate-binding protein [Enterobacter kobei]BCU54984.1 branched chain amino acid ABC transporter substrate-binding protein [Enterobacter kobei]SIR00908.1 amino acid/amide ABC transporter substrate-binding protein, HAAT family [Enterobacter kobei]